MAVRKVLRMGHPILRQAARPVSAEEVPGDALRGLIADMIDTMHDYAGIGLAAPQIGESLRLAVVSVPGGMSRQGEIPALPLTVLINPTVEVLDSPVAGYWEGCLSIPGLRGFVERPQHIRVSYMSAECIDETLELHGFLATVFQHELDHLDGILYIDRIKDTRLLGFDEEFERFLAPRNTV